MIVVTGATGNVGGAAVRALAEQHVEVRAVARRPDPAAFPAGAEVVAGDLADPASLGPALRGATGLFLLGGFATMDEVLARAAEAGVRHVVLLTSRCVPGGAPDNAITATWLSSEASLRRSGLPGTVLRPSGFQSNVLRWSDQLAAGDVVRAPWPDVPIAAIDPADIGAVAAVALAGNRFAGEALELSGPQPLTPGQQVEILARELGRPLRYEAQPDDEARAAMSAQLPEPFVDANFRLFSAGEFDDSAVVDTVRTVTGRSPRTLADWVSTHRELLL